MATTASPITIERLVRERTELLNALSESLLASDANVIGFDLDGLEQRIAEQQKLCRELAQLDHQVGAVERRIAQAGNSPQLAKALAGLAEAQARLKRLNQQHQLLLARSRRTVTALMRSYQTFAAGLYQDPAKPERDMGETV